VGRHVVGRKARTTQVITVVRRHVYLPPPLVIVGKYSSKQSNILHYSDGLRAQSVVILAIRSVTRKGYGAYRQ
jgi:hypothetical protein